MYVVVIDCIVCQSPGAERGRKTKQWWHMYIYKRGPTTKSHTHVLARFLSLFHHSQAPM
jgi:hypothetical protein